jgi:hypothetical protein
MGRKATRKALDGSEGALGGKITATARKPV